jgi:hypothetical protein
MIMNVSHTIYMTGPRDRAAEIFGWLAANVTEFTIDAAMEPDGWSAEVIFPNLEDASRFRLMFGGQ